MDVTETWHALMGRLWWPAEGLRPTPCEAILIYAMAIAIVLAAVAVILFLWAREAAAGGRDDP